MVTNAFVAGLDRGVTYYFIVIAHDLTREAPPSNEVSYAFPLLRVAGNRVGSPALSLKWAVAGSVLRLEFQGTSGSTFEVETSEDLVVWETLFATNCVVDGPVAVGVGVVGERRFFRLGQR